MRTDVSIVVPLFNRAELVTETIVSVIEQSHQNWELLVVDDHSQDESFEAALAVSNSDPRIKVWKRKGLQSGGAACRNEGLRRCAGDYVTFLDSDDLLSKNCIANRLLAAQTHSGFDFYAFPSCLFRKRIGDMHKTWWAPGNPPLYGFLDRPAWSISASFWVRNSITQLGGFREELMSWQDWELHVRALALGLRCRPAQVEADNFCRRHSSQQVSHQAYTGEHLVQRLSMYKSLTHLLESQELLEGEYVTSMSQRFKILAVQLREAGHAQESEQCLDTLVELGLARSQDTDDMKYEVCREVAKRRWQRRLGFTKATVLFRRVHESLNIKREMSS